MPVPPLVLRIVADSSGVRSGATQLLSGARPLRTPRVLLRALRAITFSLVSLFVLGACAKETARPSSTAAPEIMEITARSAEIQSRADAIEEAISGGALEREAAHYLQFEQYNRPFHECMAAKGVEVPSGFLPGWTGYRANGTSGAWMGALGREQSTTALATAESR